MFPRTVLLTALAGFLACAQNVTTVILVRHAERASASMSGADSGLNSAGLKRARELARIVADAHIQAVYTSTALRTIQTAQPIAQHLHLATIPVNDPAALAADIRAHPGRTVLVVHHSNTLPAILSALGAHPVPTITESQYDWLFIVTLRPPGEATLLSLHYGE